MCGIAGVARPANEERHALVQRMVSAVTHRGPDEGGLYEDEHVALGIRRLAIQDVSHGQQPVHDESGRIVATLNGEIYNVADLRALLLARGHRLASGSDTECIPHLFEEFGPGFVSHLRGMFAIAVWDRATRTLYLYRDRLGKKPLVYRHDGETLAYASEIKALLVDSSLSREVDPVAVSHYMTFQYVPAPWTALRDVRKLPPAHMAVFRDGQLSVSRYWDLQYADRSIRDQRTDQELREEFRERFVESVRLRLVSERPLGAFLSGGLDSSAVVAAMREAGVADLKTFSIGFEQDSHNELPHARRVAKLFATDHHEYVVKPDALDILPRLARMFDEPFADSSAIPSWYLAEMAGQHVVVALNGDGGDELLGGYSRYTRFLKGGTRTLPAWVVRRLQHAGPVLQRVGRHHPLVRKTGTAATLLADRDPVLRYARFLSYFRPEEKVGLYSKDMAAAVASAPGSYDLVQGLWEKHGNTDDINRLLAVDTFSYLPGDLLAKVDITTMSVSVEARSPFLDHTLFEWAAGIQGQRKVVKGSGKHILKQLLEEWMPHDLVHRRKQGFGVPLGEWLRGPLRGLTYDVLTDGRARSRGYFRPEAVRALIDSHMEGVDRSPHLYALVMLELWHREVLDG